MKSPTPVLLDRYAYALDRQGVQLKRAQLLETASYAFGYHNSNEFTAAAKRGDLTPPAVRPMGRINLPDGRSLIVVEDALAGAPYGIDESFLEQVVDEERREKIGVSPYGNLTWLDDLLDQVIPSLDLPADRDGLSFQIRDALAAALDQIDREIENRKFGGNPEDWAELEQVSNAGHTALRTTVRHNSPANDPDTICIPRAALQLVLTAANSYVSDLESGLADGTYDTDPGCEDMSEAIDLLELRLKAVPVASVPERESPEPEGLVIYTAVINHKYGNNSYSALTPALLDAEVAAYCREEWHEVADYKDVPSEHLGMSDREVISVYFNAMDNHEGRESLETGMDRLLIPSGTLDQSTMSQIQGAQAHRPADWIEQIAAALDKGATADIWYDAHSFNTEEDRQAGDLIVETQHAMTEGASLLRQIARRPDPSSKISRSQTAADGPPLHGEDQAIWITDAEGYDTGQVTADHYRQAGIPIENGSVFSAASAAYRGDGTILNAHELPIRLGFTILWQNRIWFAPEASFPFSQTDGEGPDTAADALLEAHRYMGFIQQDIERLGGQLLLFPNATDSAHELSILLPVDLALESPTPGDWFAALSYLLATPVQKSTMATVTAEYTAQAAFHKYDIAVDPLGDTVWNATYDCLRLGRELALKILNGEADADEFSFSPLAPEWVQKWGQSSPFDVQLIGLERLFNIAD